MDVNESMVEQEILFCLKLCRIDAQVSDGEILFIAKTREEIQKFIDDQRVETYQEVGHHRGNDDYVFYKFFKKGGPLEFYNPPSEYSIIQFPGLKGVLAKEEMMFRRWIGRIPKLVDGVVHTHQVGDKNG